MGKQCVPPGEPPRGSAAQPGERQQAGRGGRKVTASRSPKAEAKSSAYVPNSFT